VTARIVCLIATWRSEGLLAQAVASAAPHVDRVVVLDGAYAGVTDRMLWRSSAWELEEAASIGASVFDAPAHWAWSDEISKRNVLLELGRAAIGAGPDRWALVLDEDELLMDGHKLRGYLEDGPWSGELGYGLRAAPIVRVEPDAAAYQAPSRLFRLTRALRYELLSYRLVDDLGELVLAHSFAGWGAPHAPHVKHQCDRRSPARQQVRERYGQRLGALDHAARRSA
jgi:hypothetical protein